MTSERPTRRAARRRRERGVALILVVIAVVVATVLSLSFLAAQSTTLGIAQNVEHHAQARQIAEAGMALAVREARRDPGWRASRADGVWVADRPLAGGSFRVEAYDGDAGAGGGDGDLDDDLGDAVTLESIGSFRGVVHRVRNVLRGGADPLRMPFAVAVSGGLIVKNGAKVRSVNSAAGQDDDGGGAGQGNVLSNATGADEVVINNGGSVDNLFVLGDPATVVDGIGNVTGSVTRLSAPVPLSSATPPSPLPPAGGPWNIGGTQTLSGGGGTVFRYSSVKFNNASARLRVEGAVTIYVDGEFDMTNGGDLDLADGATLRVWAAGFKFSVGAKLNLDAPRRPDRVWLYQTGSNDLVLDNGVHLAARLVAPAAKLKVSNGGRLFGTFEGAAAELDNGSRVTQDVASLLGNGGGSGVSTGLRVRWVEEP